MAPLLGLERDGPLGVGHSYSNSITSGLVSGWKGTYNRFVFEFYMGGGFRKLITNKNNNLIK